MTPTCRWINGVGVVLCALTMAGCHSDKKSDVTHAAKGPQTQSRGPLFRTGAVSMAGGSLVERGALGKVWELHSAHIDFEVAGNSGQARPVDAIFYQNGKPALILKAPLAKVDRKELSLTLSEGVQARAVEKGVYFRADRLVWLWNENTFMASGQVKFVRGQSSITAGSMTADTLLKTVRLEGHPVAVFKPGSL